MSEPRRLYTAQPVRNVEPAQSLDIAITLTKKQPPSCTPELLWVAYCAEGWINATVTLVETSESFVAPTNRAIRISVSPY